MNFIPEADKMANAIKAKEQKMKDVLYPDPLAFENPRLVDFPQSSAKTSDGGKESDGDEDMNDSAIEDSDAEMDDGDGTPGGRRDGKRLLDNIDDMPDHPNESMMMAAELEEGDVDMEALRKLKMQKKGKFDKVIKDEVDEENTVGSRNYKTGLVFPVTRVHNVLKSRQENKVRVSPEAAIFTTAVLENIMAEILLLCVIKAKETRKGKGRKKNINADKEDVDSDEKEDRAAKEEESGPLKKVATKYRITPRELHAVINDDNALSEMWRQSSSNSGNLSFDNVVDNVHPKYAKDNTMPPTKKSASTSSTLVFNGPGAKRRQPASSSSGEAFSIGKRAPAKRKPLPTRAGRKGVIKRSAKEFSQEGNMFGEGLGDLPGEDDGLNVPKHFKNSKTGKVPKYEKSKKAKIVKDKMKDMGMFF